MNEQREALVRMEVYFPNFCTFIFRKRVKDFINVLESGRSFYSSQITV